MDCGRTVRSGDDNPRRRFLASAAAITRLAQTIHRLGKGG
jgi:hypothetical protein